MNLNYTNGPVIIANNYLPPQAFQLYDAYTYTAYSLTLVIYLLYL